MNIEEISSYFRKNDKFLLTTHEAPDGDGLGAEYALHGILRSIGKDVIVRNSDPHATKYDFFDPEGSIGNLADTPDLPDDISERHLVILDTDPSNIGSGGSVFLEKCQDVTVIDHHSLRTGAEYTGWLSSESSSTCEMIFQLLDIFSTTLSLNIATALYAGIVYDTGSFIYPKTRGCTFRIAEVLVNAGVVPSEVHTKLYESKSTGALMLQSLVSSTMILHENDKVAIQIMPRDTLIASRAAYEESQEMVNFPLQCGTVRVSVLFKESEDGTRRCSMRSKGEVDCAAISHKFGGGGHKTASGFRFEKTFQDIQSEVLDEIHQYLT